MLSPNGIRAIFFDLDGTLRHNLPSGGDVFADYAFQLGLHISHEDRLRAMRWEHYYWAKSMDLKADREIYLEEDQRILAKLLPPPIGCARRIERIRWKNSLPKSPSIWIDFIARKVLCRKMCFNFCPDFSKPVIQWP